jgi:hypothetical protein
MTVIPTLSRRGLIGRWLLAFLGFPIGGGIAFLLIGAVDSPLKGIIGGLVAGVAIGGAQWLALRHRQLLDMRWIAITAAGLAVGLGISIAIFGAATDTSTIVERAALTGILLGLSQAFALRRQVGITILWTLVVTVAYTLAWPITGLVINDNVQMGYVVFGSSGAIVFQFITLLALFRISTATSIKQ